MSILKKIWRKRYIVYSLPISIWFNLRHFPLKTALKLPVLLCNPHLSGQGAYKLPDKVYFGMIRLGFPMVSIFRDKGIVLENKGTIIFSGETRLGGGSAVSVGEKGKLTFGARFCNQAGGKIICYHEVIFGKVVRLGWQTLVCDTDFHTMKTVDGSYHTKGYGKIEIGDEVWVGSYCKIFKNTKIPSRCTIASNTLLNKEIYCQPYSLIYSGDGIKTKYTGLYRDIDDDKISYD